MIHIWMLCCVPLVFTDTQPKIMGVADLDALAKAPAGQHVTYGSDPLQFGELSLPTGPGPHPLVVFIHGGCWLAAYDIASTRSIAGALAREGFAVWNLEYRRVGDTGGGWPGTFNDIAAGADHVRTLAKEHGIDLSRTVAMGHSAGGHLALWLAARPRIPSGAELATSNPLPIRAVVGLAPAPQLHELHARQVCGHVIDKLMGGAPAAVAKRYEQANPIELAPINVPQAIIIGKHDRAWAPGGRSYAEAAKAAGDTAVQLIEAERAGHFEFIRPSGPTWELVLKQLRKFSAN